MFKIQLSLNFNTLSEIKFPMNSGNKLNSFREAIRYSRDDKKQTASGNFFNLLWDKLRVFSDDNELINFGKISNLFQPRYRCSSDLSRFIGSGKDTREFSSIFKTLSRESDQLNQEPFLTCFYLN